MRLFLRTSPKKSPPKGSKFICFVKAASQSDAAFTFSIVSIILQILTFIKKIGF